MKRECNTSQSFSACHFFPAVSHHRYTATYVANTSHDLQRLRFRGASLLGTGGAGGSALAGAGAVAFDFAADLGAFGWPLFAGGVFGITLLQASRTIPFTWQKD